MKITYNNVYKIKLELLLKHNKINCLYCNKFIKDRSDLTIDHVLPKSLGGDDGVNNLALVCKQCNFDKRSLLLTDYLNKFNVQITPKIGKFL